MQIIHSKVIAVVVCASLYVRCRPSEWTCKLLNAWHSRVRHPNFFINEEPLVLLLLCLYPLWAAAGCFYCCCCCARQFLLCHYRTINGNSFQLLFDQIFQLSLAPIVHSSVAYRERPHWESPFKASQPATLAWSGLGRHMFFIMAVMVVVPDGCRWYQMNVHTFNVIIVKLCVYVLG